MSDYPLKLWGYVRRADGDYEKRCEFLERGRKREQTYCIERLIRSASGRLLRVERSKRAQALRSVKGQAQP